MKKVKVLLTALALFVLLSLAALSQLNAPIISTITKNSQITPKISLEEKDSCTTSFYDEVKDVIGSCIYYYNYTFCSNVSGANTGCSLQQTTWNFQCKTGENIITKNTTECKPNDEFIISINQGAATLKKQLDYSDWGPCIYSQEIINSNSCLVVTCVSLYDGAHNGQFIDCRGGKSCQRFEICDNSIKTFYKNSREDFIADDPSFHLSKLSLGEVAK